MYLQLGCLSRNVKQDMRKRKQSKLNKDNSDYHLMHICEVTNKWKDILIEIKEYNKQQILGMWKEPTIWVEVCRMIGSKRILSFLILFHLSGGSGPRSTRSGSGSTSLGCSRRAGVEPGTAASATSSSSSALSSSSLSSPPSTLPPGSKSLFESF